MNQTFSELLVRDELLRALTKQGYDQPTPVQRAVIPSALAGRDLLVSAITGSGKTAAFLLPMMERFLSLPAPDTDTRALVLVPTRELARQSYDYFLRLGSYTRLTACILTGGAPLTRQVSALRKNPEILIATPGRLLEHLEKGNARLADLEVLVLDEADLMLDMGFAADVITITGHCSADRQSLLFSATLRHRGLRPVADRLLRDPEVVETDAWRDPHPDIHHQILLADESEHKRELLRRLLVEENCDKALVFVNTREQAANLGAFLSGHGTRTAALHGELDQHERNRVMDLLRQGRIQVLVATDLAARGLDVTGIGMVINFEVARSGRDYVHRSGRTARAGQTGLALSLVTPTEWNRMESIIRYLGLTVEMRAIDGLEAKFKGPMRSRGAKKATSARKERPNHTKAKTKSKDRDRDRKNIGKRRKPTGTLGVEGGQGPLKKQT